MDKRPLKVFLCHASADKPAVRNLYKRLVADGVDAWLDAESLIAGQNWQVEIPKAIRESDVVIVCLSEKSINKEGYVQREIKFALDVADEKPEGTIFIIPARLEECKVPDRLSMYHWVELFDKNGYERLFQALRVRADKIDATLQIKRSWRLPKITSSFPKKQKSIEVKEAKASQTNALNSTDGLSPKTEYPDGWDTEWQPVIETDKPNIVGNPQEEKPSAPKPKKRFQLPKVPSRNLMGVFGFAVLVMASIFGLPSLFNSPVETPSPTRTEIVVVLETPTSKPISTPSILVNTKTPTFTVTPTPLPTEITDAKGVTMRLVPAGEFTMGNDGGNADEKPAQVIYVDSFYIDKFEVTNKLYRDCVDVGFCQPLKYFSLLGPSSYTGPSTNYQYREFNIIDYSSSEEFNDYPVVYVDWKMAKNYCEWRTARLPTEIEWEKTSRGEMSFKYPWGNFYACENLNSFDLKRVTSNNGSIYFFGPSCDYHVGTTPVDSFPNGVSPYGVYNLLGNVSEWVSSLYKPYPYISTIAENNDEVGTRVYRGGSYYTNPSTSTHRYYVQEDYISTDLGFRCAYSP
jgi:formylglycine-generating enzyme required for sulfatase activity